MERLKEMKDSLMHCAESQIQGNMHDVDAKELGEVIDMIKDLEEAMYYCSIVEAMKDNKEEEKYMDKFYKYNMMSNQDNNRMYYDGREGRKPGRPSREQDGDYYPYPMEIRDYREGRSPVTRRNYMESKELHHDKAKQMKELEKYITELTQDILEMIQDASPEERTILSQKLSALAGRIQ